MSRDPSQTVGGQAVIEGVMMRAPSGWAVAVRNPAGVIEATRNELPRLSSRSRWARIPLIRGVMVLGESLTLGMRALSWSAQRASGEDERPLSRGQVAGSLVLALTLFAGLFVVLPAVGARWVIGQSGWVHLVEGAIRVTVFVGYIWAIGRIPEIGRVFQYHGAEHMTIHAYEAGEQLSAGSVGRYPKEHPRCGTSFLLLVVLLSVLLFSLLGRPSLPWLIASRVLLIPVIAGVSYELLRFSGLRADGKLGKVLAAPGLWLQRLTTRVPEEPMIPVAVASLLAALDPDGRAEVELRGEVDPEARGVVPDEAAGNAAIEVVNPAQVGNPVDPGDPARPGEDPPTA
ncbi:MAG TPA: DUF1385 domain-containing protein [Acidimicrobiia bacterium]|nr:DUF1385 domain-containing protein [Acidimicrobiia bacterium]